MYNDCEGGNLSIVVVIACNEELCFTEKCKMEARFEEASIDTQARRHQQANS